MKARSIRDPVYGYIQLPPDLALVVDHPLFQRLRRVSQTSLMSSVYPSGNGSRFEHGLGAMHLAAQGWGAAWAGANYQRVQKHFITSARRDVPDLPEEPDEFAAVVGLAAAGSALLHDVGHPPFSHVLESYYRAVALEDAVESGIDIGRDEDWRRLDRRQTTFHEFAGRRIARQICESVFDDDRREHRALKLTLLAILQSSPNADTWAGALHSIVAGEVDVDRLDYLIRDSYRAGTEFGGIDYLRLVTALELHRHFTEGREEFRIAPGMRARSAVESLLVQRLQSYQWIHFHPRVLGFNLALGRAFSLVGEFARRRPRGRLAATPATLVLGASRSNSVYWDPVGVDIASALRIPQVPERDRPSSELQQTFDVIALGDEADLVNRLAADERRVVEIQASVDDATVVEALKQGYFVAKASASVATAGEREELLRLSAYARAALFRQKNFIPVWKTSEEYRDAAEAIAGPLKERVARVLEKQSALAATDSEQTILHELGAKLVHLLGADSVTGVNALVDALLSRPLILQTIIKRLNSTSAIDRGGFWELEYAGYGLRKSPTDAMELYVGEEPVPLARRSALTRSVADAERSRVKLYAFFFLLSDELPGADAEGASAQRQRLRKELQSRLPEVIEEALEEHVR
jgi:HD superfamily phosphohydrolase